MPVLAFNFIIAAVNAWIGKWNRHAVAPFDNFFYASAIFFNFCKKMQKMKIDHVHCPMRKFWRTSLRPFGQNNVGILKKWDTWGRPHLFNQGKRWVKFCLPTLHFLMGRTEGKNGSFIAISNVHDKVWKTGCPADNHWSLFGCPPWMKVVREKIMTT